MTRWCGTIPALEPYLVRLGSRQIRNMGTIGGNLGTASPIGDFLPVLLALDARIRLVSAARGAREVAAAEFFTGYRRNALAAGRIHRRRRPAEARPAIRYSSSTRFPSATTRTSPPSVRAYRLASRRRDDARRAPCVRRHGGDAAAGAARRAGARGPRVGRQRLRRGRSRACRGVSADRRLAGERAIPDDGRGKPVAPAAASTRCAGGAHRIGCSYERDAKAARHASAPASARRCRMTAPANTWPAPRSMSTTCRNRRGRCTRRWS